MAPPPVPEDNPMTSAKVELGRHLFYDARISLDSTVACASCHDQARAFTDGRALAIGIGIGIDDTLGIRNAPSLANVGYFPLLTRGNPHMTSLKFQALVPMFGDNPVEMGGNGREGEIFARLSADPYYVKAFATAFPDRPEVDLFTVTRALGAFQRTLISLDSPYDRFKYWDEKDALSDAAKRGEQLFFDHRFECYHCHVGVMFTDNLQTTRSASAETGSHNTGLYNINGTGAYPPEATGLHEFTGSDDDMGRFRTPSLRNVGVTAPYFHDGSVATLKEVLAHYARAGRKIEEGPFAGDGAQNPHKDGMIIGFEASDDEIADIIAFLHSLTDGTFLTNPAYSDPWPENHPASIDRITP
nr:methanobactin export MATE transporter MbnM [Pseudorhodobacter turbinis]